MARFSKGRLIEQLREMADNTRIHKGFDNGTGTAQLWPRGCDEATKQLTRRAAEYGRWRALQSFADDLENGTAGT